MPNETRDLPVPDESVFCKVSYLSFILKRNLSAVMSQIVAKRACGKNLPLPAGPRFERAAPLCGMAWTALSSQFMRQGTFAIVWETWSRSSEKDLVNLQSLPG